MLRIYNNTHGAGIDKKNLMLHKCSKMLSISMINRAMYFIG